MALAIHTQKGLLAVGDTVTFLVNGERVQDKIRGFDKHERLLMPHAPNDEIDAVLLENHSWVAVDDILAVEYREYGPAYCQTLYRMGKASNELSEALFQRTVAMWNAIRKKGKKTVCA